MCSAPNNFVYKHAMDLIIARRSAAKGNKRIYFLGPVTYMHAVTDVIFGKRISKEFTLNATQLLQSLSKVEMIVSGYQTGLVGPTYEDRGEITQKEFDSSKRKFYEDFGVRHHSGQF